jgi:hypothetical protein
VFHTSYFYAPAFFELRANPSSTQNKPARTRIDTFSAPSLQQEVSWVRDELGEFRTG